MLTEKEKCKLKPCPFCGCRAEIHGDFPHGSLGIHCTNRGCIKDINGGRYSNKEELIKAWNTRR